MAHNRTSQYSAPYKRNTLLSLNQYVASVNFPSLGTWDRAREEDLYVVKGTVGRSQPVCITVVGVISCDKSKLHSHGNYHPDYMQSPDVIAKRAKLQFVISCPENDPDFASDYQLALARLRAIQDEIAVTTSKRDHFIVRDNLKMNFPLFERKEADDRDMDSEEEIASETNMLDIEEDKGSEEEDNEQEDGAAEDERKIKRAKREPAFYYRVDPLYQSMWDEVGKTHHSKIMKVYGIDEMLIDYRIFSRHLKPGTTVVVSFILKHYAFKDKVTNDIESDIYSAIVQEISILKAADPAPHLGRGKLPERRLLPVSQAPSRATLKRAADTFAPVRGNQNKQNQPPSTLKTSLSNQHAVLPKGNRTPLTPLSSKPQPQFIQGSSSQQRERSPFDLGYLIPPQILDALIPYLMTRKLHEKSPLFEANSPATDAPSSPGVSTESTLSTEGETGEPASDICHEKSTAHVEAIPNETEPDNLSMIVEEVADLSTDQQTKAISSLDTTTSSPVTGDTPVSTSATGTTSTRKESKRRKTDLSK